MIREPERALIHKELDRYPHFDSQGGLRVWHGRPGFQFHVPEDYREAVKSYSMKELIGQMFCVYFDEIMHGMLVDEGTDEWYSRAVLEHVERAKFRIALLIESTRHLNKKQIPRKLRTLIDELDDLEPRLRRAWSQTFGKTVEKAESLLGNLGEKGADTRLVVNLWDMLSEFTDLTKENKIEHIVALLHHFEVGPEDGYRDAVERVRQLLHGRLTSGGERRDAAEREKMLKQWALQSGEAGGLFNRMDGIGEKK